MMFKLNHRLQVKRETLQESVIYYIDNFYLHPKEVEEYIFDPETPLHKIEQKPSYNSIHFEDRRLIKEDERLHTVVNFLSQICGQKPDTYCIVTNMQRFFANDFNDYKKHVWWPHQDNGYNGIVYFSDECGTNFSKRLGKKRASSDQCFYVGQGVLSRIVFFANKLFANIAGQSTQSKKDLVVLDAAAGEVTTYRSSWRNNF